MNIYKLTQDENGGYDTYDSMVVIAESEADAKSMHPSKAKDWDSPWSGWASSPNYVTCELIGTATEGSIAGIVVASFNAG